MSTEAAVAQVRLVSIGKRYSGTKALDDVSVEVAGGTVHALVGANGAGKSTLGKIVGGVIRPDDGQLFVDDRPVRYTSPREARIDGIATISQELSPVPHMSVIENIFFGIEPRRYGLVQWRRMRAQYEELVTQWGFQLDGNAKVGTLRTADKQKVEILRAVASDARVIVMDEPTSSLTSVETDTLHRMMRALRERGRTIVYVSHFLDEVLELADTVTVLRSGRLVRTGPAAAETEESLVAGMFGAAAAAEHFEKPKHLTSAVVLDVSGLDRKGVLSEVSLQIRAGEIVGLAGLVGSGRSELARAIAGADPVDRGTITVDGTKRHIRSPADAMAAGMAFLPESRKDDGLFLGLSLAANTTFADLPSVASRFGVLRLALERRKTTSLLNLTSVQPPVPSAKVVNLSGGNQQKVLFARWLFRNPRVLILDEPTRGVDVAARAAIHRLINNLAAEGTAVLLISSEIEEVLGLAHRVLVMRRGSITTEFGADPPMEAVMEAAFGLGGRTIS
ncbi:MAG: ribose transport system ATP-binding protein [Trebonia sp.]|jgi:ABC-type sugar transport system ATPase subunit|nr:transporter related protein [Actinomycetes bacterium]MDX6417127.1 ribose transport system ATP-binding protein [Trebonia sp.]